MESTLRGSAILRSASKSEKTPPRGRARLTRYGVAKGRALKWKRPDAIQEPNRMGNGRLMRDAGGEADDPEEREHYSRLRDAWITLAKGCEPLNFPDVADTKK